ncbi:hypothetical protein JXJ21_08510 [candidate division KSB1 bacterium]|nr:hypothetical protein [candidate division KSB1 bacterium]
MRFNYTKMLVLTLIVLNISQIAPAQDAPKLIFNDSFSAAPNGSDRSPVWHISKGHWQLVDGIYNQTSPDYDCGAMLDFYIDYSFSFEAQFRVLTGEPGAGFFFFSEDLTSTEYSHMIRFETDETLLIGHFVKGGYEATTTASFAKQDFSQWHAIKLVVDQDEKCFTFYLDQTPLAEAVALTCHSGFPGLQSSGGHIQFKNVKLYRLSSKESGNPIQWSRQVAFDRAGNLLLPMKHKQMVCRLNDDGTVAQTIGAPVNGMPVLQKPIAAIALNSGDIAVADIGNHRLVLFDEQGNWKAATGYKGEGREQFDGPVAVAANSASEIFVADEGNNRIKVFDKNLVLLSEFGKDKLEHPTGVAAVDTCVYVLNSGANRIETFTWNNSQAHWQGGFSVGAGECRAIAANAKFIYLAIDKEIKQFTPQGELKNRFSGRAIGEISPHGIALNSKGEVVIADFIKSRLIFTNEQLSDPAGIVDFPSKKKARIQWTNAMPSAGRLQIKLGDEIVFNEQEQRKSTQHTFFQKNLQPSTVYHYRFAPTLKMLGNPTLESEWAAFISPPEKGMKHYRRSKMATLIFTEVIDTAKHKPELPPMPPLSEDELNRIISQIDDGILFYWMNSNLNFFIDMDYVVVRDRLYRHQVFDQQWWYPPLPENIPKYLALHGKNENDYQGIIYIACIQEYDNKLGKVVLRGRGGGFTMGVQSNGKYGVSYWEATRQHHNSGNNWLFVHEYHHQLDALFLASGYPEYWFCHFAPTIGTAADFGEHFDGNAWILRNWQYFKWYDLKYGTLELTRDNDEDGIPDDDPALPMDEKRLKSDPRKKDTDGDGVSDFDELVFSNWVEEGVEETMATRLFANLNSRDTDGDGISDKADRYPLFAANPDIIWGTPQIDGELAPSEWTPVAALKHAKIQAEVFVNWDSTNLCLALKMNQIVPVKLMLDADSDGWFNGRDNYWFKFSPKEDGTLETEFKMQNCSDPERWPFMDKTLTEKTDYSVRHAVSEDGMVIEIAIPRNEYTGLALNEGEEIGLLVGFLVDFDADGHKRYLGMWEPNRFFDVTLVME